MEAFNGFHEKSSQIDRNSKLQFAFEQNKGKAFRNDFRAFKIGSSIIIQPSTEATIL